MSFLTRRKIIKNIISTGFILPSLASYAQFRIELSGTGLSQWAIAIPAFMGEENLPQKISPIVLSDLIRSGAFRAIEGIPAEITQNPSAERARLRTLGADTLLMGSISRAANGRFEIKCRLLDVARNADIGSQNLSAMQSELRYAAHKLADWIYEKLTGTKGVAATRIAYVTQTGARTNPYFQLWVADSDGEMAHPALASREPIISPAWSPNGQEIAYVSFESRKPVVYAHELASGNRRVLADFKGSNSAPAWSPDGKQIVVTLSRDGGSQMFLINASGQGEPKKLSTTFSIDTEAVFAPDGQAIYFVSDRGGSPQIYRMPSNGGTAQRITFSGNYNISPAISPDGTKLAFISRTNRSFRLVLQDLATGTVQALTDTQADESPSFSPNGRHIIYATQVSSGGRLQEALMITDIDGRTKSKITAASGDLREPDWGGF